MAELTQTRTAAVPAREGAAAETIPGVILRQARRLAERDYVHYWRDGDWHSLTWEDMAEKALRVAGALVEAGLEPGAHVALLSENRVEWLYCDLGIQAAGCVTVPIYPSSVPKVISRIIEDAGVELAIASGETLAAKLERKPPLRQVALMGEELRAWVESPPKPETRAEVERRLALLRPEDIATVIYTSGTTGEPKGVMLRHRNFVVMASHALEVFDLGESDVVLSFLPFSHVLERMDGIFVTSSAGCTIWLARSMDSLVEDIAEVRPTMMLGVPRVFEKVHEAVNDQVRRQPASRRAIYRWAMHVGTRRLQDHGPWVRSQGRLAERLVLGPLRRRLTGGRLRFFISGGAPLNQRVEEFFWALGVQILQGWGLTESTSGVTSNTERDHRYRTAGKAMPGIELLIADDGEILVRGPAIMAGYKNRPEATAETIVDGWLKTGDMGFLDGDGFLTITDRKKDLIKTAGGKYVAPLPIESTLEADRYVRAAMVVGDERPYAVALIVPDWEALAADHGFTGDPALLVDDKRVRDHFQLLVDRCNQELASFETIKRFALLQRDFSEALDELTPTLKPKRRIITQHFQDVIEGLYASGGSRPG